MSEQNDGQEAGQQKSDDGGFTPITSQEELNRVIGERLKRVESKYADYDDLKAKADKYAEFEESQKTELQKALERAEAAEKARTEAEQTALKVRIATEEGVIPEVLTGSTEEEMRATAQKLKEWASQGVRKPPSPKSLKSGSGGGDSAATSGKERAAQALRRLNGGN